VTRQKPTGRLDLDALYEAVVSWFAPEVLETVAGPAETETERIARAWLAKGGKRWRPFLAACAFLAFQERREVEDPIPKGPSVRQGGECVRLPGRVAVVSAGTSDQPVAEEARVTAELMGCRVETFYDVGVAGIHRLLAHSKALAEASVVVVVAGMEGALASVVGGLVDVPVIAVPTSVGYGACFQGLAPLLTMLNSCAAGVGVVNIDNGFGAGCLAAMILRAAARLADDRPQAES